MDESTASDAPADAFRIARKGYDRQQVDAHVSANARRIGALEKRIQELESGMSELGLDRPTDLATELDLVGEEIKRVLNEARVAAERMRTRSADDAARWRAEADTESRKVRDSARADAYAIRGSVWETGTEMLADSVSESEALVAGATERALLIQAEAEREASHLTGDARREREESVRATRDESETVIASARQEAESVLSAARRQADAAEERARALEVRRTELMAELEAARATIAGVEAEAEPEPEVVPEVATDPEPDPDEEAVAATGEEIQTHWPEDEGSVKIVSASRVFAAGPVDADAMAAEVQALRKSPVVGRQSPVGEAEPTAEPAPSSVPPTEGRGDAEERSDEAARPPGSTPEPEPSSVPPTEGRGDAEERSDEAAGPPGSTPEPEPEPEPTPDPLAGLFAQLRTPLPTPKPAPPSVPPTEGRGDEEERGDETGGQAAHDPEPFPAPEPAVAAPPEGPTIELDPFGLRERLLLPIQNRALRTVKRHLVEAQNRSLENLRLTDDWQPDASIIADEVVDSLAVLAHESMVAGFTAAAEMLGTEETPQPDIAAPPDSTRDFAAALLEATQASVARSRASGAGQRETGASLSRVFRSWRTDDAERRVRFASRSAYEVGVAAALADLGVSDVAVATSGRPCPECPANKGPWRIGDGPPVGTSAPPARLECACTVVPSP